MNPLERSLQSVGTALETLEFSWALVGGLAVSVRAEPRFTRDVDVAVAVDSDSKAEALVRGLQQFGFAVLEVLEQESVERLATTRLSLSGDEHGVVVDLLFASSGIEPEITFEAEVLEVVPGMDIPVARIGHLIALKLLSRNDSTRPQDLADLRALLSVAAPTDIELAKVALLLITERGYHRGRELERDLARFLEQS